MQHELRTYSPFESEKGNSGRYNPLYESVQISSYEGYIANPDRQVACFSLEAEMQAKGFETTAIGNQTGIFRVFKNKRLFGLAQMTFDNTAKSHGVYLRFIDPDGTFHKQSVILNPKEYDKDDFENIPLADAIEGMTQYSEARQKAFEAYKASLIEAVNKGKRSEKYESWFKVEQYITNENLIFYRLIDSIGGELRDFPHCTNRVNHDRLNTLIAHWMDLDIDDTQFARSLLKDPKSGDFLYPEDYEKVILNDLAKDGDDETVRDLRAFLGHAFQYRHIGRIIHTIEHSPYFQKST